MPSIVKALRGVHVGDTTTITYVFRNAGTAVDITGATIVLYLEQSDGTVLTKSSGITLSDPTNGHAQYTHLSTDWISGAAPNIHKVQGFATLSGGGVFKSDIYRVHVEANLA